MNKKILAILITFLVPNYNFSSELNQKQIFQKIEEGMAKNENSHPYLIEYQAERERLIAFKQKLQDLIQSGENNTDLSYNCYQYTSIDLKVFKRSNIHIEISSSEINKAIKNKNFEQIFLKIDSTIEKIEHYIRILKEARYRLELCLMRDGSDCKEEFENRTKDLEIYHITKKIILAIRTAECYSIELQKTLSETLIDKYIPALSLAQKTIALQELWVQINK